MRVVDAIVRRHGILISLDPLQDLSQEHPASRAQIAIAHVLESCRQFLRGGLELLPLYVELAAREASLRLPSVGEVLLLEGGEKMVPRRVVAACGDQRTRQPEPRLILQAGIDLDDLAKFLLGADKVL